MITKEHKEHLEVMDMVIILTTVMVSRAYTSAKTYQILCFKYICLAYCK